VLSTGSSIAAAARAAETRVGLLIDSFANAADADRTVAAYRRAGGHDAVVLNRRVFVGNPPDSSLDQLRRAYATGARGQEWLALDRADIVVSGSPQDVTDRLADDLKQIGATSLNLRVHLPGLAPPAVRQQIERLGAEVLPRLRAVISPHDTQTALTTTSEEDLPISAQRKGREHA